MGSGRGLGEGASLEVAANVKVVELGLVREFLQALEPSLGEVN